MERPSPIQLNGFYERLVAFECWIGVPIARFLSRSENGQMLISKVQIK